MELGCDLSNGVTSSDLERHLTQISRSRRYSTLNISVMAQCEDMEDE